MVDIKGLHHGNDLQQILPNQYIELIDDDLSLLFYNKFVTESLLQFDTTDKGTKDKGNLIVFMDYSGSMRPIKPLVAAFGMAIAKRLSEDERRFQLVLYTNDVECVIDDDINLVDVLRALSENRSGGTKFGPTVKTWEERKRYPVWARDEPFDTLVLTDGMDVFNSSAKQRLKDVGSEKETCVLFKGKFVDQGLTSFREMYDSLIEVEAKDDKGKMIFELAKEITL